MKSFKYQKTLGLRTIKTKI